MGDNLLVPKDFVQFGLSHNRDANICKVFNPIQELYDYFLLFD